MVTHTSPPCQTLRRFGPPEVEWPDDQLIGASEAAYEALVEADELRADANHHLARERRELAAVLAEFLRRFLRPDLPVQGQRRFERRSDLSLTKHACERRLRVVRWRLRSHQAAAHAGIARATFSSLTAEMARRWLIANAVLVPGGRFVFLLAIKDDLPVADVVSSGQPDRGAHNRAHPKG